MNPLIFVFLILCAMFALEIAILTAPDWYKKIRAAWAKRAKKEVPVQEPIELPFFKYDDINEKKSGFHPKRFLKRLQYKLYNAPALYLIFCFIVPIFIMYIIYACNGTYPFGETSPLVLDLNAQYVHFFTALRQWVYGDGSLLYSFSRSLGGEFMGIYAYYLASPFTYIVALFPLERMQEAVLCILLLKTGFCGLSMGYYLHKRSKKPNRLVVLVFSLLYALCAYSVIQQNNTMWIDAMILLPIFVYALENLILNKRYKLYVITLSAILITNYYIGYMMCIFAVFYFFYYYFSKKKNEINPRGEKLHFIRAGARFALFSLLGAMISAFMLIAAYYSLKFGKSEFSNPNWALNENFSILDFFVKFLPGSFDTVEPAGLPFVYCGVITLFLVPVYFMAKKVSVREKISSFAFITVFVLGLIVVPLDLIWHGFSMPNWLNSRYSFMLCFFLLVLAYKGFAHLRSAGEKFILGIGAVLVLLVAFAEKSEFRSFINSNKRLLVFGCVWFSIFFIVTLTVLLCLRIRLKNSTAVKSVSAVMAALICVELLCNGVVCFIQFDKDVVFAKYEHYTSFFDDMRPVVNQVKEYDNGFYRMEKTRHRTKNDNMALGINGLTNSTSTLNASAINLVGQLGYTGRSHLTMYKGGTVFTDSLLGIKYVIDSSNSDMFTHTYSKLPQVDSELYKVMQNPYAMSLAYGVDKDTATLKLENYDCFFDRYNAIATAMLGEDRSVRIFKPVYGMSTNSDKCEVTETSASVECVTEKEYAGKLNFTFTAPYTGDYYFYSSAPNARIQKMAISFNITDPTTKKNKTVNSYTSFLDSDTNHVLWAGYYEEGTTIDVQLTVPKNIKIKFDKSNPFLWYLDKELYTSTMTTLLNGPQFRIDANSKEHDLTGSLKTSAPSQMILTTIPYDEGWSVFVDGKKVETYKTMDALMAFDIENAGEHSIEMKYMPSCYIVGAVITIIGILALIALCVLEIVLKKTLLKNRTSNYVHEYWELDDLDDDRASLLPTPKRKTYNSENDTPPDEQESAAPDETNGNSEDTEDTTNT